MYLRLQFSCGVLATIIQSFQSKKKYRRLTLTARGSTLDVRIGRLYTSDSDV